MRTPGSVMSITNVGILEKSRKICQEGAVVVGIIIILSFDNNYEVQLLKIPRHLQYLQLQQ